jgi:type VI secretion system lysozyme-like protein
MPINKPLKKLQRPLPLIKRLLSHTVVLNKTVDWQEEIAESLMYLLNTHQGSVLMADDFGLPDFSPELVGPNSLRAYEQNMKNLILKYEPRFKEVEVRGQFDTEHKNHLIFHFKGVLDSASFPEKLSYYTVMTDHGRLMMRAAA